MVEMASGCYSFSCVSLICLVLLETHLAANAVNIKACADIVQRNNQGGTAISEAYVKSLQDCLQLQQTALEETTLNLTNLIGNLKSTKEKRYVFHKVKLNWTEAMESCDADGQGLATIKNKEEHEKYLADMPDELQRHIFWIGGFDPTNRGNFVWVRENGKGMEQITYHSWAENQPQRTCGPEYDECLGSENKAWSVASCVNKYFYSCEYYSVPLKL